MSKILTLIPIQTLEQTTNPTHTNPNPKQNNTTTKLMWYYAISSIPTVCLEQVRSELFILVHNLQVL